ncbi:MAG: RNA-binding protein [Beijerinckiaceae bacterium]
MRDDEEKGPNRTCAATREVRPVADLIRFVAGPDGVITPDVRAKLPGRGVWVTCERASVEMAIKRKAFARGLKAEVSLPADMADQVERLLAADMRQSFAMANKAGQVVFGFAKVESAVSANRAVAALTASDGAPDGRRKMGQIVARLAAAGGEKIPHLDALAGEEMDLALGRENVIHAALLAGSASNAFLQRYRRWQHYRHGGLVETGPDVEDNSTSSGPFVHEGPTG